MNIWIFIGINLSMVFIIKTFMSHSCIHWRKYIISIRNPWFAVNSYVVDLSIQRSFPFEWWKEFVEKEKYMIIIRIPLIAFEVLTQKQKKASQNASTYSLRINVQIEKNMVHKSGEHDFWRYVLEYEKWTENHTYVLKPLLGLLYEHTQLLLLIGIYIYIYIYINLAAAR